MIITLNYFLCRLPFSTLLTSLRFYDIVETYSSITSFWLMYCLRFSIFGRFVTFPDLREVVLCRNHPTCPSSAVPSDHQSYMIWGCPLCRWAQQLYTGCCGRSGRRAGPRLVGALPCLVWTLSATGGPGCVPWWLITKPQGSRGSCWPSVG